MLSINAKRNQTVQIDNRFNLTVDLIGDTEIQFILKDLDECEPVRRITTAPGLKKEILPSVFLLIGRVRTTEGLPDEVQLLFEAPRSIKIRGSWFNSGKGSRRTGVSESTLRNMTDTEFLWHIRSVVQGPIEQGLWSRMNALIGRLEEKEDYIRRLKNSK